MLLPQIVTQHIDRALHFMRAHPDHRLLPIYRRAIYRALHEADQIIGTRARIWLDIYAVQQVIALWQPIGHDPQDSYNYLPQQLLTLAEGVMQGTVDRTSAEEMAAQAQEMSDLTGESALSPYFHAWCVFEAALCALVTALGDDPGADVVMDAATTDEDLRYQSDAAKWVVTAYAGGRWEVVVDAEVGYGEEAGIWDYTSYEVRSKRRGFWEWWLHEAISAAWQQASM